MDAVEEEMNYDKRKKEQAYTLLCCPVQCYFFTSIGDARAVMTFLLAVVGFDDTRSHATVLYWAATIFDVLIKIDLE